ncbi:hypothetical protein [Actinomadura harenae]|uniref:Uncharacterized protein n=1 Tax=Actinomadura harenae TaxID=2483351 RepID=A0A3M2LPX8_9ACTN|nr:hypothetical protein [Actinomadura harenae]RMI39499.1 hypothetical protein EBO15_29510 [Actinomadura harenae]
MGCELDQRIALRRALDIASAAYTEAMRSYGLLQGTITAVHALAEANLDRLFAGDAAGQRDDKH